MVIRARGDRREQIRFVTLGELWASLRHTSHTAAIRDVSLRGALIELTWPVTIRTIRVMDVVLRDGGPSLTGIVRHVRPAPDAEDRWLVGLEFVRLSASSRSELMSVVAADAR